MKTTQLLRYERLRRQREAAGWVTFRVRRKVLGAVQGLVTIGLYATFVALCMLQLRISVGG